MLELELELDVEDLTEVVEACGAGYAEREVEGRDGRGEYRDGVEALGELDRGLEELE